jgi:hypothetical protein
VGAFPTVGARVTPELYEYLLPIVRRLKAYSRLGADQQEAAKRLALEMLEQLMGHTPTAQEIHWARNHLEHDADPDAASGEL